MTIEYIKKKNERKTTDIDCPLCGKKRIFENPQNTQHLSVEFLVQEIIVRIPLVKNIKFVNTQKMCGNATHTSYSQRALSDDFLNKNGDTSIRISDLHHYEAYVIALEKVGLKIDNKKCSHKKTTEDTESFLR